MSMYDMLQSCPTQKEALLKSLDHIKSASANNNTKNVSNVNVTKAMSTMFKDRVEVPLFLLSLKIFDKNFYNCLIDSGASCNMIPFSICQKLGMNPEVTNRVMIQLNKTKVRVIGVLKDTCIQLKTFTKWRTFSYHRMPFSLINASTTFQWAMDEAFKGLVNKYIVIYMDDLIVFSRNHADHIQDL